MQKNWIRWVQVAHFKREMQIIRTKITTQNKSLLTGLHPFLDEEGILRVGGRLRHSFLSLDERHPVILPPTSNPTWKVVESCHKRSLHGGAQLTMALVRLRFWVPRRQSLAKQCIHRCVNCVRWRAATSEQLMADLPRPRVTPARPF